MAQAAYPYDVEEYQDNGCGGCQAVQDGGSLQYGCLAVCVPCGISTVRTQSGSIGMRWCSVSEVRDALFAKAVGQVPASGHGPFLKDGHV